MRNLYTIAPHGLGSYALRETLRKMKVAGIVFGIFLLIIFFLFSPSKGGSFMFPFALVMFGVVSLYIALVWFFNTKSLGRKTYFEVTEEAISQLVDSSRLSFIQQYGAARGKAKYGATLNKSIQIKYLNYTKINPHDIVFKSVKKDLLNENHIIRIPKEVSGYDEIVQFIQANAQHYNLIH